MRQGSTLIRPAAFMFVLLWISFPLCAESRVFKIDPERSRVLIQVGKTGLLSFAGHEHEVTARDLNGEVRFDPAAAAESRVWVEIEAASLEVTGKGEPAADVPEVQATMLGERVLDVQRYPTIRFGSSAVAVRERRERSMDLTVDGSLTLHGVTRPVRVDLTIDLETRSILARGRMTIKQTEFGLQPVSAAGGAVKVKDLLRIDLSLTATAD